MNNKEKSVNKEQVEQLKSSIAALVSEVQKVRLSNNLSKLTQVRLVDLQYSAKLAVEDLNNKSSEHQEENNELDNA